MDRLVLVGFQGSGKNTFGEILVRDHGYTGISFADALKDCVAAIFCWDRDLLEGITPEAREWRETVDEWWSNKLGIPGLTPRWAMRNFGTDVMRTHFHTDVWISNVERRILDLGQRKVVVFDGRFPNEIDMVKRLGGKSIRVKRGPEPYWYDEAAHLNRILSQEISQTLDQIKHIPGMVKAMNDKAHQSEWAWIGHPIDYVVSNDGAKEDLLLEVKRIIG